MTTDTVIPENVAVIIAQSVLPRVTPLMQYYRDENGELLGFDMNTEPTIKEGLVLLNESEVDLIMNPPDTRTDEEKLAAMKPLTRYQFFRVLLEKKISKSSIEDQINAIPDDYQRELALLGWQTATVFMRTDPSVLLMTDVLQMTRDQVNDLWNQALTY